MTAAPNFVPDFMKKKEDVPAVENVPTTESAPTSDAPEAKDKKPRQPKAKEMTAEQIAFVHENVTKMSYTEMAEKTGLTKHQVNRILMELKKILREQAGENTEAREKVEKFIAEHLSRPEDTRPGGGAGRNSNVKGELKNRANNILAQLGINI